MIKSSNIKVLLTHERTNKHVYQIASVILRSFEILRDLFCLD